MNYNINIGNSTLSLQRHIEKRRSLEKMNRNNTNVTQLSAIQQNTIERIPKKIMNIIQYNTIQ
jgi:hypothetical protein